MATVRFTTYSDNIGVNVLNLQIRNFQSALSDVKLLNNSAAMSWKGLVYSSGPVVLTRFYFVQNSKPLVVSDPQWGSAVCVDCLFDIPLEPKLFSCSFSITKCEFDVENPILPSFATLSRDICVDRFAVKGADDASDTIIWWLLGIAVCGAAGYVVLSGRPKGRNDDERQPFRHARKL